MLKEKILSACFHPLQIEISNINMPGNHYKPKVFGSIFLVSKRNDLFNVFTNYNLLMKTN